MFNLLKIKIQQLVCVNAWEENLYPRAQFGKVQRGD